MITTVERQLGASIMTNWVHHVLGQEAAALSDLTDRMHKQEEHIDAACRALRDCRPDVSHGRRVVVAGVGKAGLIGRKVAATLSSTGTPALFVHPVEALHGDLGGVCERDCALLFSYSGETPEVVRLAEELQRLACLVIAVTRSAQSGLGRCAEIVVELGEIREACELGLAPSSTTTAMLALGDALALAAAKASGFTARDFATKHPAGMLGLRFRHVSEVMRAGRRLVCLDPTTTIEEVVRQVSAAKTGSAVLVDDSGTLVGIFTDGDLRRALLSGKDVTNKPVGAFASIPCSHVNALDNVADAWKLMLDRRIEDLPVVGDGKCVVGLLCLKDIKW